MSSRPFTASRAPAWCLCLALWFPSALPAGAPKAFVVFPLEMKSEDPSLFWVGEGVALSLAEGLRSAGMTALTRDERVRLVEGEDLPTGMPLSRASMIRVAQQASADFLVYGSCSGAAASLQVSLHVFDLRGLRLGGNISGNGPVSYLAQMENDLSWLVLANNGLDGGYSREQHLKAARPISNEAYSLYVRGLGTEDKDTAAAAFLKAVALYPAFPDAHFRLGRHYAEEGNCAKVIHHLDQAVGRGEANPEAHFMLGNCRLLQGELDEAVEEYRAVLEAGPSVEAANNLGVAYLRKGDAGLAGRYLLQARVSAAEDATVALNLAILRYSTGSFDAALEVIDGALQPHPSHGMLRYLRSLVLAGLGRAEDAAAALEQARRFGVDPGNLIDQDPKSFARVFQTWKH